MHKEGLLGKSKLVGLVKEIAPCATAKDDSELGVGEFQSKYFNNYPVYLDQDKTFYAGGVCSTQLTLDLVRPCLVTSTFCSPVYLTSIRYLSI